VGRLPQADLGDAEIRALWDHILDVLLERIHHRSISETELARLVDELNILLHAAKGRNGVWASVIDIALLLLERDISIRDLRTSLSYNEFTMYRAIERLCLAGIASPTTGETMGKVWTINRERCPVLWRATRQR